MADVPSIEQPQSGSPVARRRRWAERWWSADAWSQFTVIAFVLLLVGALLPDSLRLPGPPAPTTTTTLALPDAPLGGGRFDFDLAGFRARWNEIVGDEVGLQIPAFTESSPDAFTGTVESLGWVVLAFTDGRDGPVEDLTFITGVPDSETAVDEALVGMAIFIAAVERAPLEVGAVAVSELLDSLDAESAQWVGIAATYRLVVGLESGLQVSAKP